MREALIPLLDFLPPCEVFHHLLRVFREMRDELSPTLPPIPCLTVSISHPSSLFCSIFFSWSLPWFLYQISRDISSTIRIQPSPLMRHHPNIYDLTITPHTPLHPHMSLTRHPTTVTLCAKLLFFFFFLIYVVCFSFMVLCFVMWF